MIEIMLCCFHIEVSDIKVSIGPHTFRSATFEISPHI